jgi:hypothetical protein
MATEEVISENKYFIMLDVTNTLSENEIASRSANIQIVYPPNRNTYLDIKAIMNRFEGTLKFEEKRKQKFTITLNPDIGYKTQRYR